MGGRESTVFVILRLPGGMQTFVKRMGKAQAMCSGNDDDSGSKTLPGGKHKPVHAMRRGRRPRSPRSTGVHDPLTEPVDATARLSNGLLASVCAAELLSAKSWRDMKVPNRGGKGCGFHEVRRGTQTPVDLPSDGGAGPSDIFDLCPRGP